MLLLYFLVMPVMQGTGILPSKLPFMKESNSSEARPRPSPPLFGEASFERLIISSILYLFHSTDKERRHCDYARHADENYTKCSCPPTISKPTFWVKNETVPKTSKISLFDVAPSSPPFPLSPMTKSKFLASAHFWFNCLWWKNKFELN